MKKSISIIVFAVSACTTAVYAQIGINTATPTATLDVTAKNSTGKLSNVDGLLIPRVDRERAQSMTSIPNSTLIFINSIATGDQGGNATNIDETGYYFFDAASTNKWVKLKTPAASPTASVNIYNADGNLTNNRLLTQGANTLAFSGYTGTATNAFSVDGTTLSVNALNDRVGAGTSTPQKTLHVNGTLQVTNELNVGGNATTTGNAGTAGQILTSNGAGAAPSWETTIRPVMLVGGTIADAIASTQITVTSDVNASTNAILGTYSFTLDHPSIVDFSASVSSAFHTTSGTIITDGSVKGAKLFFRFTGAPAGIPLNTSFGFSGMSYTNTNLNTNNAIFGLFFLPSHSSLSLPAGNYTVNLIGEGSAALGFRLTFGIGAFDMVQIKAIPL